jgi:hypothetical protein
MTLAAVLCAATPARAEHNFGVGLEIGEPIGLCGKYYLGSNAHGTVTALSFGLGAIQGPGPDGLHMHVDFLWHPAVLARTPDFSLPFYIGGGARLLQHSVSSFCVRNGNQVVCYDTSDDDTHLGVRVPVGILMDFNKVPLDLFFEIAVVVDFLHVHNDSAVHHDDNFVDLNADIGVRYYF